MKPKLFIKMKRETWEALEPDFKTGDVFDYPIEELADLVNGTVGSEDQMMYAVTGDRIGELVNFPYVPGPDDSYTILADDVPIYPPGITENDTWDDLGAVLDTAYEAFKSGMYKKVECFTDQEFFTFE